MALYDKGSIDTAALTGGQAIEAGNVGIRDLQGRTAGGFAWFVDDNGMKAKLNASPDSRNDDGANGSNGILPASYDPSILEGMDVIANATPEEIQRLGSLLDLEFLGASKDVARGKYFGYTAQSLGVLADVKNGGLKKDLSVAFDWQPAANSASNPVFDRLFPRTGGVPSHFIVADRDRLNTSELSELNRDNGYINFAIFRDYYRLKDHLQTVDGVDCIWPTNILRNSLLAGNDPGVYQGDSSPPASQVKLGHSPHGSSRRVALRGISPGGNAALYRDNPLSCPFLPLPSRTPGSPNRLPRKSGPMSRCSPPTTTRITRASSSRPASPREQDAGCRIIHRSSSPFPEPH